TLASKITIDVNNYLSLTNVSDSVSKTYTSDDEQSVNSQQSRPIINKVAEVQTAPINNNNGLQPVVTKSKKCSNDTQSQTQAVYVLPCNINQKYKKLKKILTAIITNNTTISNLIETINAEIFEKYNLWKNVKFVKTENNALKFELSTLKTKYIDLKKEITNLKEKITTSNERKTFLELQGTKFKYTIKTLEDTIKSFEATINLKNNEINLKAQHKEFLKELTLLKNKNEKAENRKI
ncbi:26224_t:CDS:2, partial [Racocetra persica]